MTDFRLDTATRRPQAEREAILADPGFGSNFSDHMVLIDWTPERGWHDHRIVGYAPFVLDPASGPSGGLRGGSAPTSTPPGSSVRHVAWRCPNSASTIS
mgnify:CR=1 FL=1